MSNRITTPRKFNTIIFCMYQATSDDLIFWCWFDVLILSMNYHFNMTQISLFFSVSFWINLILKLPFRSVARRIGAGRSVLLSALMFLAAAVILTFGSTLFTAIVGQSIYLGAMSFQEMATVVAKNAARRYPDQVDYMGMMSVSGIIYSVISLIASLSMSSLYDINVNLPMYICIGFCISSCILASLVSSYDHEDKISDERTHQEVLPGVRIRTFDKTTLSCLFLSVVFMVIFTVSGENLKILLDNDLSGAVDNSKKVFLFSMILMVSRLIKIISNLILYICRRKHIGQESFFHIVAFGVVMIAILGYTSRWVGGYSAIILAAAAFFLRILVYDPFRFSIYDFMLKRLSDEKMITIMFVHSIGIDFFTALFQSLSTLLLRFHGMQGVLLMLLVVSIVFFAGFLIFNGNLIRINGTRRYLKWPLAELETEDSMTVAAAALMLHYGIVSDTSFDPKKLGSSISSVRDINRANRNIRFEGLYDYDEDKLKELFCSGHPCAVRAAADEGDPEKWLPVVYLDDDGGLVWNPYSENRFLAQMHTITEICSFTVS